MTTVVEKVARVITVVKEVAPGTTVVEEVALAVNHRWSRRSLCDRLETPLPVESWSLDGRDGEPRSAQRRAYPRGGLETVARATSSTTGVARVSSITGVARVSSITGVARVSSTTGVAQVPPQPGSRIAEILLDRHRAHDTGYQTDKLTNGDIRFHRRR